MAAAATDLLARLQVLLDADTAEFDRNITGSADTAEKGFDRIKSAATALGKVLAVAAAPAALIALTKQTIDAANEISTLSTLAGVSAEKLQYYAAGAKTLGIEQDALADIFKDTNEKIGEFVATEGGGLSDFFENIAPKVGVTAEQFAKLSGPDALGLYVKSLEKANLSNEQMTFYMESFASDSTKLLPLLRNNAEGFKSIGDAAKDYGAILSDDVIANSNKLENMQYMLELQTKGFKNEIVAGILPTMVDLGAAFATTADNGIKLVGIGDIVSATMKGIAASALGAFATVDLLGTKLNEVSGWKGITKNFAAEDFYKPGGIINIFKKTALEAASARMGDEADTTDFEKKLDVYGAKLDKIWNPAGSQSSIKALGEMYAKLGEFQNGSGNTGNLGKKAADEAAKAANQAAKEAENAAKQIQKAYESQAAGLERQIALFDITTNAAQMKYDLENTEMAKFAPKQKTYLQGLAQELDYKKQDKLYLDSYKDASHEATSLQFTYDINRKIYELQIQAGEKYKELSEVRRKDLIDLEKKNLLASEYKSLTESLLTPEERRTNAVIQQLTIADQAFKAGKATAESYKETVGRIFDSNSILPGISTGTMDKAGIETAQTDLENKYILEQELLANSLNTKAMQQEEYQQRILNLELDYNLRSNALKDQADAELAARKKAEQEKTVAFFNKGLDAMANSSEKYAKAARAAQKLQALYKIGVETKTAAISAYQWAVGFGGPVAGALAAAAAVAFGMAQAKAVISDSGSTAATTVSPSTPATTVTPVAEQPAADDNAPKQTTTISFPADKLMIGRDVVDFINEAIADGKRLDPRAISFVAV